MGPPTQEPGPDEDVGPSPVVAADTGTGTPRQWTIWRSRPVRPGGAAGHSQRPLDGDRVGYFPFQVGLPWLRTFRANDPAAG